MAKRKSKGAYMISAVAEMYGIHPQTLRLYEREGLLKPSRTEGNTRLYTDEDLQRLEFILTGALGVQTSDSRDQRHAPAGEFADPALPSPPQPVWTSHTQFTIYKPGLRGRRGGEGLRCTVERWL